MRVSGEEMSFWTKKSISFSSANEVHEGGYVDTHVLEENSTSILCECCFYERERVLFCGTCLL